MANAHHSTRARNTHFAALFQIKRPIPEKIQKAIIHHRDFIEGSGSLVQEQSINYSSQSFCMFGDQVRCLLTGEVVDAPEVSKPSRLD